MIIDKDKVSKIVSDVQKAFVQGDIIKADVFDVMLNGVLDLTGSEYGFIGETLVDHDNLPYLNTISITNIAWTDDLFKIFSKRSGIQFKNLNTLFGLVLTSQKYIISNNPETDRRRGGKYKIPNGHPPLNRFCGIPCIINGKMIGMIGIANALNDYNDNIINELSSIIDTCSILIASYTRIEELSLILTKTNNSFSMVSHELRTPLNSISGYVQLLHDVVNSEGSEYLTIIDDNCNSLLRIVDDVLNQQNPSATFIKENINLHNYIIKYIRTLALSIKKMDINLKMNVPEDTYILCDKGYIDTILSNFLSNAVKYNKINGEIIISITNNPFELLVSNTGIVIDDSNLLKIFKPFFRENISSSIKGSGIGLSLVKEIATKLGQEVYVTTDKIKEINTFHFTLEPSYTIKQHNIIYVEDNANNVKLMEVVLSKKLQNYDLVVATTAKQFYNLISSNKYDIILMDLNLPDGNGLEIIKNIRASGVKTSAIIITADATLKSYKDINDNEIKVITKPYNIVNLIKIIQDILKQNEFN